MCQVGVRVRGILSLQGKGSQSGMGIEDLVLFLVQISCVTLGRSLPFWALVFLLLKWVLEGWLIDLDSEIDQ